MPQNNLSLYSISIPALIRGLENVSVWLTKAEVSAKERGFDSSNYLGMRLAPDQFPFVKQVQLVSDIAKSTAAKIAGIEVPKMEDNEKTITELQERMTKTIAFVKTISKEQVDGGEDRKIAVPYMDGKYLFASEYVEQFALPNFYFHVTLSYELLRHAGVALGKRDFLTGLALKDM